MPETSFRMASATTPSPIGTFTAGHIDIRPVCTADMPAITALYGHHVRHGHASFELEAPPVAEMQRRREALEAGGFPYLVAERGGKLLGYAYAGAFRPRPAYRHTVEDSIYVHPDAIGQGIGRLLLAALIARCEALGFRQMIAVVGGSDTLASIRLHEHMGFQIAGTFTGIGYKHDEWRDSVMLQRALGAGTSTPPGR